MESPQVLGQGEEGELLMRKSYVAAQRMDGIYFFFPGEPKKLPEKRRTAFLQSVMKMPFQPFLKYFELQLSQ